MAFAVPTGHIAHSITVLEELLNDVASGRVTLTQTMFVKIKLHNFAQPSEDSRAQVTLEPIGSISGSIHRVLVIYENTRSGQSSLGIYDEIQETILPVDVDGAIQWMNPEGGKTIVERDLIEQMWATIKRLYK